MTKPPVPFNSLVSKYLSKLSYSIGKEISIMRLFTFDPSYHLSTANTIPLWRLNVVWLWLSQIYQVTSLREKDSNPDRLASLITRSRTSNLPKSLNCITEKFLEREKTSGMPNERKNWIILEFSPQVKKLMVSFLSFVGLPRIEKQQQRG